MEVIMKLLRIAIILVLSLSLMLAVAGCGSKTGKQDQEPTGTDTNEQAVQIQLGEQVSQEDSSIVDKPVVLDKKLTETLVKEKEVANGQVYFSGEDWVIGTMIIEEGVSGEQIKKLAEKYANDIKKNYPDKKVNVQAVQNGVNLANIMIE
jgi:ABC-type phosphate transport system substrate-binding protein